MWRTERGRGAASVLLWLGLLTSIHASVLHAAPEPDTPLLRVALLPFEYEEQDDSRIGQRIADLLAEALRLNPALKVLSPEETRDALDGPMPRIGDLLRGDAGARLGSALGVDAAVTGQGYVIGDQFYVVARVIGCASGRVFGAGAEGSMSAPLPEIVDALAPGVDDLLAERRLDLTLPGSRARQAEEALAARVRALRRQKEPPPVILVVAEGEETPAASANTAQERLGQRVRRLGLTTRPQRSKDILEWARALHEGGKRDIPGPLRGQGIVLAMRVQIQSQQGAGALSMARAIGDAEWLDARDGTRLATAGAFRDAVAKGQEPAASAAARRLAQAIFEESFSAALTRWEARHKDPEPTAAQAANAAQP